jgi:hypothetical protein
VLVELFQGDEEPSLGCPETVWDSETLSLDVVIDPYIQILSISPLDEVRELGDTDPVTYVAEVEVGGDPVAGHLQCVVFDIFGLGDGQQTVSVDYSTAGTYFVDLAYDISTYALGDYPVVAVAVDAPCDTLADSFSSDYEGDASDTYTDADTVLHIVEPAPEQYSVSIEVTGDGSGSITTDGELEDGIACYSEGEEQDCEGTYEEGTELTLVATPDEGSNFDSSWTVGSGTCTGNTTPCTVTVNSNLNLVAHFALNSTDDNDNDSSSSRGSRSSGTRVGDRDNNDTDEAPEGEVLGASTDEMPAGAPNTWKHCTNRSTTSFSCCRSLYSTQQPKLNRNNGRYFQQNRNNSKTPLHYCSGVCRCCSGYTTHPVLS